MGELSHRRIGGGKTDESYGISMTVRTSSSSSYTDDKICGTNSSVTYSTSWSDVVTMQKSKYSPYFDLDKIKAIMVCGADAYYITGIGNIAECDRTSQYGVFQVGYAFYARIYDDGTYLRLQVKTNYPSSITGNSATYCAIIPAL